MKICLNCKMSINNLNWNCVKCAWQPAKQDDYIIFSPDLLNETSQFFDKKLFEKLYEIENKNFWFRARNQLITWSVSKFFPKTKKFLEIGCGTGYVISAIQKLNPNIILYAADVFQESLPYVKNRVGNKAEVFQMDGRNIPFLEEFDLIGAFDVLEHIEEDEKVIEQIYQALKPEGGLLISVPQHPSLWSSADDEAFHVRRYRRDELQKKLVKHGFEIIFSSSFVSLLLPFMLISRKMQSNKKTFNREFNSGKILNLILERILSLERIFIKSGIHFPIGGSRYVVARKKRQ